MSIKTLVRTLLGALMLFGVAAPAQAHLHSFAGSFSGLSWGSYSIASGGTASVVFWFPRDASAGTPKTLGKNMMIGIVVEGGVYFDGGEVDTASTAGIRLSTPRHGKLSAFVQVQGGGLTWSGNGVNRGYAAVPGAGVHYAVTDKVFVTGQVDFFLTHFPYGFEHPIRVSGGVGWMLSSQLHHEHR